MAVKSRYRRSICGLVSQFEEKEWKMGVLKPSLFRASASVGDKKRNKKQAYLNGGGDDDNHEIFFQLLGCDGVYCVYLRSPISFSSDPS